MLSKQISYIYIRKFTYVRFFAVFLIFQINNLYGQSGPGGVGSSANNKVWLDANRGLTLIGGLADVWADQSGNGFNATANGATARPTFVAASVNGYPSLDFDGTNDEMWIPDNAALDLTAWHIFIVPIVDLQKNYNAWLVKGDDAQENFEMLSFSNGNIHTPTRYTDATRTSPSTAANQVSNATFRIIEYSYSSAVGRDIYTNYTNVHTDNENKTPATNNFPIYVGNEKATAGRFINGDLAEVIIYNAPINSAQRIIVNNYLSAKYGLTLGSNDIYDEDNAGNGNYDHDVAGIGRVDASNIQNDSQGSGIVRILNPTGLGNNEFYIWGHDNGGLGSWFTNDYPAGEGLQGRLVRVWRGSEQGTINSFSVRFDLTGLGPVSASDLRLLIDVNNNGLFADETAGGGGVINGATALGGNVYEFTGITGLNNNIRFTLGTSDIISTPLPVELVNFTATPLQKNIELNWSTLSEKNFDYFELQKSKDATNFKTIAHIKSKSTNLISNTKLNYNFIDELPYEGMNYYRLNQVNTDKSSSFSEVISIPFLNPKQIQFNIYPNPNSGEFVADISGIENNHQVTINVTNTEGKQVYSKDFFINNSEKINIVPKEKLANGLYTCTLIIEEISYSKKVLIK
ncbi:MAG: T9SS type A sorting domain-containing protein [Sphingobacteriaceae bacterium]|nr:T9SS type A sorting domain-containing protein [Sphingobacteriaceae bacterium]